MLGESVYIRRWGQELGRVARRQDIGASALILVRGSGSGSGARHNINTDCSRSRALVGARKGRGWINVREP